MSQLPNILWGVFDALRWDHLSCYGHHRQTTPNIDRLATEGARYLLAPSPADRAFAYTRRTQMDERGKVQFRKRKWTRRFLRHDRDVQILRTAQWQFRLYGNGERALYDVEGDPAEHNDMSSHRPEITDELHAQLEAFLAQASATNDESPGGSSLRQGLVGRSQYDVKFG